MLDNFINQLKVSQSQLKVFFGTMIAMFTMMSLQYLGVHFSLFKLFQHTQTVASPVAKKHDIYDSIKPKLEKKADSYRLMPETNFIAQTYAASNADNAKAYAVVDFDSGTILAAKNADAQLPIAS